MKRDISFSLRVPAWLWAIQAVTGLLLVIYVIIHTVDNATILLSQETYEDMLALWHESLPSWFYFLMVLGLAAVFLVHAFNGIRIASKPYRDLDVSWTHNVKLKHTGTTFWYTQVLTGSAIAMFGIWHLIVQHGNEATTTAAQSAARVSPFIFTMYLIFLAALMFHSFNGCRSVILKLGVATDKGREGVLVGLMALLFIVFFALGALSMAKFIPDPVPTAAGAGGGHNNITTRDSGIESNTAQPAEDLPIFTGGGNAATEVPGVESEEGGD
jgi:succinate dehydrogenase/fumarate reductase cytochrome b subunit